MNAISLNEFFIFMLLKLAFKTNFHQQFQSAVKCFTAHNDIFENNES